MSRLVEWYVAKQLNSMGWPRAKGLLRKVYYVPTQLVDLSVGQGLQICMGLGAGRPEMGARVIADAFLDNPWTSESTTGVLEMLSEGDDDIARHPDLSPWTAILAEHTMAPLMTEIEWETLGRQEVRILWAVLSAKAALWGLSHEDGVSTAFEADKRHYEETAPQAVRYGLAVPTEAPWQSLDDFYEACEEGVKLFESERPALAPVPRALRDAPAIARRFGSTASP